MPRRTRHLAALALVAVTILVAGRAPRPIEVQGKEMHESHRVARLRVVLA